MRALTVASRKPDRAVCEAHIINSSQPPNMPPKKKKQKQPSASSPATTTTRLKDFCHRHATRIAIASISSITALIMTPSPSRWILPFAFVISTAVATDKHVSRLRYAGIIGLLVAMLWGFLSWYYFDPTEHRLDALGGSSVVLEGISDRDRAWGIMEE